MFRRLLAASFALAACALAATIHVPEDNAEIQAVNPVRVDRVLTRPSAS